MIHLLQTMLYQINYINLDEFLNSVDLVVLMVGHSEIRQNMDKLEGKIVLDTRNICDMEGVYRL